MMAKTEISIEAERLLLFSRDGREVGQQNTGRLSIWCKCCRSHVKPITTNEAAILTRVNSSSILGQVEAGLIHYMETSDGRHLICPNSL